MISRYSLAPTKTGAAGRDHYFSLVEIGYFGYLWFSMFGVAAGIAIPNLGAVWLSSLGVLCIPIFNWRGLQKKHLLFVSAISGFHILMQVLFYNQPLTHGYVIDYFWWPFTVLVIAALMQRPNFFKRLTINMLIVALVWSPFVVYQTEASVERATLSGVGNVLGNANAYGAWLGYCMIVLWLWSLKVASRGNAGLLKIVTGVALVVALKGISRGFIIATASALLISLRKIKLSRTVIIFLVLGGLTFFLVSNVPFFQQIWQFYGLRFAQETSRANVFNIGVRAIVAQPILGYGLSHWRAILPITPHNELLLLWITSGIAPAILYIAFVFYFVRLAFRYERYDQFIDPLPLIVFVLMEIPLTNLVLPRLWAVSAVCYVFAIGDWLNEKQIVGSSAPIASNGRPLKSGFED